MGGFQATNEEKRQMAMKGYSDPVVIADGPSKLTYHDPKTGKEMSLPADAHNIVHYLARGLMVGPAPADLKKKYEESEENIVHNTVYGTELPPELRDTAGDELRAEVSELKDMMKALLKAQTSIASVPFSEPKPKKKKKKNVIIEEEEVMDVPFDTQLGMFI